MIFEVQFTLRGFVQTTLLLLLCASCGPPKAIDADQILNNLNAYLGERVTIKTKLRSGARCGQKTEEDSWQAYCKDCQHCKGPLVVVGNAPSSNHALDDWPLVLGGTYEGKDIRCKGPLNNVLCQPFDTNKTYIIQGRIERYHPPRLMVKKMWDVP